MSRSQRLVGILLVLICFFASAAAASAATIYANSSTGNDTTGTGSSGSPYQTFTKAYASASSGDTINLTGTFDWSNPSETTSVTTGFTIGKNITIMGQGATSTFIQASSTESTANRRVFTMQSSNLTVTFQNLTIRYGNVASDGGGVSIGASWSGDTIAFKDCALSNNHSTNGYGGAFYDYYTGGSNTFTMDDCTVANNSETDSANGFGGGLQLAQGQATITNSTFTDNGAKTEGAAISQYYGSLTATDSTFTGNYGSVAITNYYNSGSDKIILTDDTIAYNTSSSTYDGAGFTTQSGAAPVYVENTIIFGNTNASGSADWYAGGTASGSNNIIGSQLSGTNFTNGVSGNIVGTGTTLNLSSTLAANSTTKTTQTLALSAGSAAIDAGTFAANSTVSVPFADQRGLYRNGNPDIGAYEYNANPSVSAPTVSSSNVTFSSVTQTSLSTSWTAGNGGLHVVFVAATTSPTAAAIPANNTTYTASSAFGAGTQIGTSGWYAVYKGAGTSASITGLAAATAYQVQVVELNGDPGSEQYFSATSTGNPAATTTIAYATPTTPAKNVTFGSVSGATATVGWTSGNGTSRIVLMAATTSASTAPVVNNTTYAASSVFGSGAQIGSSGWYAVYSGTGTGVSVSNLTAAQPYAVDVIEYNGTSGYQQYVTTATSTNPYLRNGYTGTTIYSNSSSGNDSTGTGTSGNPYLTFTKAYNSAVDGDTINLNGTFNWANAGETGDAATVGYTIGKSITITGQSASSTIIEAASTDNTAAERIFTISSNMIVGINDLELRYGKTAGAGGCVFINASAIVTFSYDDLFSCRSAASGGGIEVSSATTTIQNSSLRGNVSSVYGGGIYTVGTAHLIVTDSTLTGNYATTASDSGGGAYLSGGSSWFTNDTITGNESYEGALTDAGAAAYFKNTIIAGNAATSTGNADLYRASGTVTSEGNNIFGAYVPSSSIATTTTDWTNTSGNGTFLMYATSTTGTLSLNATPAADPTYGTYTNALQIGSIGIDQGNSASYTAGGLTVAVPATDQRNLARINAPDIGAYEYGGGSDVTPPVISGIASSTTATSATITWTTDENASSTVNYGSNSSYGNASTSPALVTSHSISLSGLSSATLYHFQVASADASNNLATSSDYTFTTIAVLDTTPPSVSLIAPLASEATSSTMTLAASASDNVAVAGVTFYIDGTKEGSEITSAPYSASFDTTATTSGSHTAFAVARDTSNNYATSSAISFTVSNSGPTPSSIVATPAAHGATIAWHTSSIASSRVWFGPTSGYGSSTAEIDLSPRATAHSVTLALLPSCALFHYKVAGTDAFGDSATSSDMTFTTSGCTGGAAISATALSSIATSTGGTVSQGSLTLQIPVAFATSTASATFQASQLDRTAFFNAAGIPSGMSAAASAVYNLQALVDASTTVSSFAAPLTITMSYGPSDIVGILETSLKIYRYDAPTWTPLSSCVVDTTAKTVTCATSNFSDFALFGDAAPVSQPAPAVVSGANGPIYSGSADQLSGYVAPRAQIDYPDGTIAYAATSTMVASPTAVESQSTTTAYQFTRTLRAHSTGPDVKALQRFLNDNGFPLALSGMGSLGQESDTFGPLTYNALVKFQEAHAAAILAPVGATQGTGIFGPSTRAFINALLAAGRNG